MLGKLLGAATVGRTLINAGLLRRFLPIMANIVMLAVVTSFLLCALVACGFTLAYFGLVHYGIDHYTAAILLVLVGCMMAVILIALTLRQIRLLRGDFSAATQKTSFPDIGSIAEAFLDGFLNPPAA